MKSYRTLIALTAVALLGVACGESDSTDTATTESPTPTATAVGPEDMPDQQRPPDRTTIDISIEGGRVEPTNAQVQAKVGQPIVVRVNSDAADELHVHSNPEHTFEVEPQPGQQFQFTVDVPGQVDVELHDLNQVVATIQVQP